MLSPVQGHDAVGAAPYSVELLLQPAVRTLGARGVIPGTVSVSRPIPKDRISNLDDHRLYDIAKRAIDIVGSIALLVFLTPVLVATAVAVRVTTPGPALYRQRRLTAGRRTFEMLKFRTMVDGAESISGPVWATEDDPRVTRIGKFLRSSRIDELPQLLNVLRGEMSLIGPRPERPEIAVELAEQFPFFDRRLAIKGGITGLAQVSAGYAANLNSYRHKFALDILYIEKRSLLLDIRIALRTVRVVLTGDGAR